MYRVILIALAIVAALMLAGCMPAISAAVQTVEAIDGAIHPDPPKHAPWVFEGESIRILPQKRK